MILLSKIILYRLIENDLFYNLGSIVNFGKNLEKQLINKPTEKKTILLGIRIKIILTPPISILSSCHFSFRYDLS